MDTSRARSTKTRIETPFGGFMSVILVGLREPDPRKQGLKPIVYNLSRILFRLREPDPRKQGLKRHFVPRAVHDFGLREPDPRKQGLKHD